MVMIDASESSSTRPYLIRALYEWCTDNGHTPFLAVLVDETVRVPNEYVKDGEIVLNISFDATSALSIGNEFIEFKGRFGGVARDIYVPVGRVLAIYARENGQGMAFPMAAASAGNKSSAPNSDAKPFALTPVKSTDVEGPDSPRPNGTGKPSLTRIK
jgi:stringent starvation protein B